MITLMSKAMSEKTSDPTISNIMLGATTSVVYNEDCLKGVQRIKDKSVDFAIIDANYEYYSRQDYKSLISALSCKLSDDSLLVIMTNNKFLIDAGYYAKMFFEYWFMQHWIYDDGYLIHNTQPKDANRTILYFRKGNPSCDINALRGDRINKKPISKGTKFRNNESARQYVWTPNENGAHPLTYFYYKHTAECHGLNVPKPVGVKPLFICNMILNFSNSANVLDLFTGFGSFRIEANKLGKSYIGFEIDVKHYESQEKRFNDFVSQIRMF